MEAFRARPHGRKERGAVMVLVALALPLVMVCLGLAVDLGHLYIRKSRLQNAADAAALAGARQYAMNGETADAHPRADETANAYAEENAQKRNLPGNIGGRSYRAQLAEGTTYYRVALTEDVPLFFLRFIRQSQPVSADAVAAIEMTANGDPLEELFIFTQRLGGVNTVKEPNADKPGQLATTFDGQIAFTDGSGANKANRNGYAYEALQYSTQSTQENPIEYFYTSKARNENLSLRQAEQKQQALDKEAGQKNRFSGEAYAFKEIFKDFNMAALGETTRKRMGLPDEAGAKGPEKAAPARPASQGEAAGRQDHADAPGFNGKKDMASSDLSRDVAWSAKDGDGNASITIDKAIPGGPDAEPVYVYLDKNITQVNFRVSASNERPLVLVYDGSGTLQMDMATGTTFRGIVYAPRVGPEGVLVNVNGGIFRGSVVAASIWLQGGQGTFIFEDFGVDGTGGGSVPDKTARARLVPSRMLGLSWD